MIQPDRFRTERRRDPPNEELLNTIREHHPEPVGTGDIVKKVELKSDAVRDRLKEMEERGRVEFAVIGSENDYTYVWYLADDERREPVNPEIDRIVELLERLKEWGRGLESVGRDIVWASLTLVVLTIGLSSQDISLPALKNDLLIMLGLGFALGGVAVVAGAQVFKVGPFFAERLAEWYIESDQAERVTESENQLDEDIEN